MTIKEAIDRVDLLKPNTHTTAQKALWLSELDTRLYWNLVRKVNVYDEFDETGDTTYDTGDEVTFQNVPNICQADGVTESPLDAPTSWAEETWTGYDSEDVGYDEDTVLLCPVPYDIPLYTYWLSAQISFWNREINFYNNELSMFNATWQQVANHLFRTFTPVQKAEFFQL